MSERSVQELNAVGQFLTTDTTYDPPYGVAGIAVLRALQQLPDSFELKHFAEAASMYSVQAERALQWLDSMRFVRYASGYCDKLMRLNELLEDIESEDAGELF